MEGPSMGWDPGRPKAVNPEAFEEVVLGDIDHHSVNWMNPWGLVPLQIIILVWRGMEAASFDPPIMIL